MYQLAFFSEQLSLYPPPLILNIFDEQCWHEFFFNSMCYHQFQSLFILIHKLSHVQQVGALSSQLLSSFYMTSSVFEYCFHISWHKIFQVTLITHLFQPRVIHFSKEPWFFLMGYNFYRRRSGNLGVLITIEVLATDILNRKEIPLPSYQSEWPSLKSLHTINPREGMEKRTPSCTVHGNVNWCDH